MSEEAKSTPGIQQTQRRSNQWVRGHQPTNLPPRFIRSVPTEKGLTLLECLMAVTVMGLTISLVLPPLLIAAATRVQTRRAEQALQLAQGEVDRVRNLVALNTHISDALPAVGNNSTIDSVSVPTQASSQVKTSAATCPSGVTITRYTQGTQIPYNRALLVDIDADCQPDFLMQVFRTQGKFSDAQMAEAAGQRRPSEFDLGVRVYSILAGRTNATNATPNSSLTGLDPNAKPAPLGLTSGQGRQLRSPLAVLYTSISWSDRDGTLCSYQADNALGEIESCLNY